MFNQTTQRIFEQLACGEFRSGQQLGELLGISRAAIGKHINALQELGLTIYSVTGKGYRLENATPPLDSNKITNLMPLSAPLTVEVNTVVDSTNEVIKQKILQGELSDVKSGYTVFAEAQTAGRGRRGRQWVSPLGSSLYFSTHWRFEQGISATMGLSLAVGIALTEALNELGVAELGLKWPNDVYCQGKKLAGILIELESQGADSCDIVIGVGLNIKLPKQVSETIDQPYIDLSESGIELDRNLIAATILAKLQKTLVEFEANGFKGMVSRWNKFDCFVGHTVQLLIGQRVIEGIARGVDEQGGIVLSVDGNEQTFFGGEISLRKVTTQTGRDNI